MAENGKELWACFNCSDPVDSDKVVLLQQTENEHWRCPKCGCTTGFPKEDGCWCVDANGYPVESE